MDPITAVGFATSIVQLIGVAKSITSTVRQIRQSASGLPKEAEEFRNLAKNINISLAIIIKPGADTKIDDVFRNYATDLQNHVKIYVEELDKLKVNSSDTGWRLWRAAIKAWWNSSQMEESTTLIHRMGSQVTMHIISVYLPAMDSKLGGIHDQTKRTETRLAKDMEHLLETVKDVQGGQKDGNELLKATKQWFADQETIEKQQRCLRALYFPELEYRQAEVESAHVKTFEWVMEEAVDNKVDLETETDTLGHCHKPKIRTWLGSPDSEKNVFWISGKPGAGKSTLMKYVATHPDLPRHLGNWVGFQKLIIARYFFWNHGVPLQRSIEGLLRSLLFQILRFHPHLISETFTDQDWDMGG